MKLDYSSQNKMCRFDVLFSNLSDCSWEQSIYLQYADHLEIHFLSFEILHRLALCIAIYIHQVKQLSSFHVNTSKQRSIWQRILAISDQNYITHASFLGVCAAVLCSASWSDVFPSLSSLSESASNDSSSQACCI